MTVRDHFILELSFYFFPLQKTHPRCIFGVQRIYYFFFIIFFLPPPPFPSIRFDKTVQPLEFTERIINCHCERLVVYISFSRKHISSVTIHSRVPRTDVPTRIGPGCDKVFLPFFFFFFFIWFSDFINIMLRAYNAPQSSR